MMSRIVMPVVLGALVASGPALAADMTPAQQCATLQTQFDKDIFPYHIPLNPTSVAAKAMRDEGVGLCTAGKPDEGAAKLRGALAQFGVKPHA